MRETDARFEPSMYWLLPSCERPAQQDDAAALGLPRTGGADEATARPRRDPRKARPPIQSTAPRCRLEGRSARQRLGALSRRSCRAGRERRRMRLTKPHPARCAPRRGGIASASTPCPNLARPAVASTWTRCPRSLGAAPLSTSHCTSAAADPDAATAATAAPAAPLTAFWLGPLAAWGRKRETHRCHPALKVVTL